MTRYDDLRAKWSALIDGIPVVVEADDIVNLADDLFDRFEHHDDAPEAADALIAAAAIVSGRTLITENWRDFISSTICLSRTFGGSPPGISQSSHQGQFRPAVQ